MWKVIALTSALAASVHAVPERPEVGWVIDHDGVTAIAQVVATSPEGSALVWRLLSTSGKRLAEMVEPKLLPGYEYSYGECTVGGKLRSDLIAEIKVQANSLTAVNVQRVWMADPTAMEFHLILVKDITCYNADYGL